MSKSEIERIEELSAKLYHHLPEVRYRAATNLLSKLQRSIVDIGILKSTTCVINILDGIIKSLILLIEKVKNHTLENDCDNNIENDNELLWIYENTSPSYRQFDVLLELVINIVNLIDVRSISLDKMLEKSGVVLDKLYTVTTYKDLGSHLTDKIEDAIKAINNINTNKDSNDTNMENALDKLEIESYMNEMEKKSPTNKKESNNIFINRGHVCTKLQHVSGKYNSNKKASAILNSALVFTGWKFPLFIFTDRDERFLFDLEVKIKLGHDGCESILMDVLVDFPPQAILSRPGLIHGVIDIVGSTFTSLDIITNPLGLTPPIAMTWLEKLMNKASESFLLQMEGSMCSSIPNSVVTRSEEPTKNDDTQPGTAVQMARAMYALRHPILPTGLMFYSSGNKEVQIEEEMAHRRKAIESSKLAISPPPSLPGYAFAICAAAMPLLQTRDTHILPYIVSLLSSALPFIMEPEIEENNVNTATFNETSTLNLGRFQHILNRIEQIFTFYGKLPSIKSFISKNIKNDEEGNLDFDIISCESCLEKIFIDIISALPVKYMKKTNKFEDKTVAEIANELELGPQSLSYLTQLCASQLASSIQTNTSNMFNKSLIAILSTADKNMSELIMNSYGILSCSNALFYDDYSKAIDEGHIDNAWKSMRLLENNCINSANNETISIILNGLSDIVSTIVISCLSQYSITFEANHSVLESAVSLTMHIITSGSLEIKNIVLLTILDFASKSVNLNNSSLLISNLSNPLFIHALIMYCIYNISDDNSNIPLQQANELISSIRMSANSLLDILLRSIGISQIINSQNIKDWCLLLCPLKVIEWHEETDGTLLTSISKLTEHIENLCASSPLESLKSIFARSFTLGLFHSSSDIRCRSMLRIKHELLGLKSPSESYFNDSGGDNSFDIDPFAPPKHYANDSHNDLYVSQGEWVDSLKKTKKSTDNKSKNGINSSFRHSDVRKLSDISFGRGIDRSLRVSAMKQLYSMLNENDQLIQTADFDWCYNVVKNCLIILSFEVDSTSNLPMKNEYNLQIEAALLIKLLVITLPNIRNSFSFSYLDINTKEDKNLLSIEILLEKSLSIIDNNQMHARDLHIVKLLSSQVIFCLLFSYENWVNHNYETSSSISCRPLELDESSHLINNLKSKLIIPIFLASSFYPVELEHCNSVYMDDSEETIFIKQINHLDASLSFIDCNLSAEHEIPLPPNSILDSMLVATMDDNEDQHKWLTLLSSQLIAKIDLSTNHDDICSTLRIIHCLGVSFEHFLYILVNNDDNLTTSLRNILKNCPRSPQEYQTLSLTLKIINQCVCNLINVGSTDNDINKLSMSPSAQVFIGDCFDIITGHLSSILSTNVVAVKTYKKTISKDAQIELDNSVLLTQASLLSLMNSLLSISWSESPLYDSLSVSSLPRSLAGVASSELFNSHIRSSAASSLEFSIKSYHGWTEIHAPLSEAEKDFVDSYSISPIDSITRSIKLIRTPDSMFGTSALVGSLRVLYVFLQSIPIKSRSDCPIINSDWKWMLRLAYDRRADIRLLSLKIMSIVIPYSSLDKDDTHIIDSNESNYSGIESNSWPPFQFVEHIMMDISECSAVRIAAMEILVNSIGSNDINSTENEVYLGRIMAAMNEFLTIDNTNSNLSAIRSCVSSLMTLINDDDIEAPRNKEIIGLLKLLKLLPLIISTLNPDLLNSLNQTVRKRVLLISEIDHLPSDRIFVKRTSPSPVLICNRINGWKNLWNIINNDESFLSIRCIQTTVCRFFQSIEFLDSNLFDQCLVNSSLASNIITNLTSDNYFYDNSKIWKRNLNYSNYTSLADLLAITIKREIISKKTQTVNQVHPFFSFEKYLNLSCNITTPMNILSSISRQLDTIIDRSFISSINSNKSHLSSLITSNLRLLCYMVSDSLWRNRLKLGGPFEGCPLDSIVKDLVLTLVRLRVLFIDQTILFNSTLTTTLVSRIDVSLSLIMQYSYPVRLLMMEDVISNASESHYEENYGPAVMTNYLRTVCESIDAISSNKCDTSSDCSVDNVKSALKTLKTKVVSPGKSKNSHDSRWREKARSYNASLSTSTSSNVNGDSVDGSVSIGTERSINNEYTIRSNDRLLLWSALLNLQAALPGNSKLQKLSGDVGLADVLSMLLKLCVKWSTITGGNNTSDSSIYHNKNKNVNWIPQESEISSAILGCLSSFAYDSDISKTQLAQAGDVHSSLLNNPNNSLSSNQSTSGGFLHQLLSIGLSKGIHSSCRWVCLRLLTSIVGTKSFSPSTNKTAMTRILSVALQKSLHSSTSDPESLMYLIDAYSSCLSIESLSPGLRNKDPNPKAFGYTVDGHTIGGVSNPANDASIKELSVPDLLDWIWEKYSHKPYIVSALLRCLGRMGTVCANSNDSSLKTNPSLTIPGRGSIIYGSRKLLINTITESPLKMIATSLGIDNKCHAAVVATAMVALWSIMSNSEQARATYKSLHLPPSYYFNDLHTTSLSNNISNSDYLEIVENGMEKLHLMLL
jgi:hypothetical protein